MLDFYQEASAIYWQCLKKIFFNIFNRDAPDSDFDQIPHTAFGTQVNRTQEYIRYTGIIYSVTVIFKLKHFFFMYVH